MKNKFFIAVIVWVLITSCGKRDKEQSATKQNSNDTTKVDSIPESIGELYSMAETSYNLSAYEDAVKQLSKIVLKDSTQGQAFFRRGKAYAALRQYDASKKDYERSATLGFHVASCFYNIGCNYMFSGNDSSAIKFFKKTLRIDPNHEKAKFNLGRLEKNKNQSKLI